MQLFSTIKEKIIEYTDVKIRLYQIALEERFVKLGSDLLYQVLLGCLVLLALIFNLLFLSHLIHYFTGNELAGPGLVAFICLLLVWYVSRPSQQKKIITRINTKLSITFKDSQHGDESTPGV